MKRLSGRVAVVTGAASGIGRALADVLAGEGAKLVLADIEPDTLAEAERELAADGADVLAVPTDVTRASSVQSLAHAAVASFGAVHIVCNNAGVSGVVGRSWMTPLADWRWVFEVNVFGVIHGIRSFLPILLEQDEGHIVNTGSAACFEAVPGMGPYGASKHALLAISESLQRELSSMSARVGVSVLIPAGIVKSRIMSSERNWPSDLGARPERDSWPLTDMIRTGFTAAIDNGADPHLCAVAAVDAMRTCTFMVSDDPEQLGQWGQRPGDLARGLVPTWP